MTNSSYERLEAIFERIALLTNGERNLSWDRRTLMPRGGGETRANMIAMNRENPAALDQRFLDLKPVLAEAVKDHSAL